MNIGMILVVLVSALAIFVLYRYLTHRGGTVIKHGKPARSETHYVGSGHPVAPRQNHRHNDRVDTSLTDTMLMTTVLADTTETYVEPEPESIRYDSSPSYQDSSPSYTDTGSSSDYSSSASSD